MQYALIRSSSSSGGFTCASVWTLIVDESKPGLQTTFQLRPVNGRDLLAATRKMPGRQCWITRPDASPGGQQMQTVRTPAITSSAKSPNSAALPLNDHKFSEFSTTFGQTDRFGFKLPSDDFMIHIRACCCYLSWLFIQPLPPFSMRFMAKEAHGLV